MSRKKWQGNTLCSSRYTVLNYHMDLGGCLASWKSLYEKHKDLLQSAEQWHLSISNFLGSKLHDSWIISIDSTKGDLTIKVNDFIGHLFFDAVVACRDVKIPHKQRVCEVSLVFKNVKRFSLNYINRNDKIIPVKASKYFKYINEYLYDEVLEVAQDKIMMGIVFDAQTPDRDKSSMLLELEAEKLLIEDNRRIAIVEAFGENTAKLFDEYLQLPLSEKTGIGDVLKFVRSKFDSV